MHITIKEVSIFLIWLLFFQVACSQKEHSSKTMNQRQLLATKRHTTNKTFKKIQEPQKAINHVKNLGSGFKDLGVAVPIATSRGTVATKNGEGDNVILIWLSDHRGTYSLLMINVKKKWSKQFFLPFHGKSYTSLLSSNNRYYTQFNGNFVEFNPSKHKFTFIGKTSSGTAMSMAEGKNGIIWAALYPHCSLVSFNPKTNKITNYGSLYKTKGKQYPRYLAADDAGWIYVTAGRPGHLRVIAFNTNTHKSHILTKVENLTNGYIHMVKVVNGHVLANINKNKTVKLQQGKVASTTHNSLQLLRAKKTKYYTTGTQQLYDRVFPNSKYILENISNSHAGFLRSQKVTIHDPQTNQDFSVKFNYKTEGITIMGVATDPTGDIIGGSNHPPIFFQFNPENGHWQRHTANNQFNTLLVQGHSVFIGAYNNGLLLKWNPKKKWIPAQRGASETNPKYLASANPYIYRPFDLLAYPRNNTVIMAGSPSATHTNGGLLFWNKDTHTGHILKQIKELPNQSTRSLAALSEGKIVGGTKYTGYDKEKSKNKEARLYIMDTKSKKVIWSKALIPNVRSYEDLCVTSNGLIVGVAGRKHFFVFDPEKRKIIKQVNLKEMFKSIIPSAQGQRIFIKSPNGIIYLLLKKGILKIKPDNFDLNLIAKSPVKILGGGAYLNNHLYFIGKGRSHLYSYSLKAVN